MGGHDSNVGPGRPNVEPTVETLKEALEETFDQHSFVPPPPTTGSGKSSILKEAPPGEMVLDDEANGKGGKE